MRFIKWYAVALVVLTATACSKQTNTISKQETAGNFKSEGLTGSWEWVRTDGGIGYNIHDTPLSTGKHINLKLSNDSTYTIYTNSAVTSHGTYRLETRDCIHDHTSKTFLQFSSDGGMMVEKLDAENLELSDEFYDGVGYVYKRSETGAR